MYSNFFFLLLIYDLLISGDTVGCGIIYPSHYKRYAELSTDDNSDGMTDVVLSSLLNTNSKSMNFVCSVLKLNNAENESSSDSDVPSNELITQSQNTDVVEENEYYNENFVESRTQVEVSFFLCPSVSGKCMSQCCNQRQFSYFSEAYTFLILSASLRIVRKRVLSLNLVH